MLSIALKSLFSLSSKIRGFYLNSCELRVLELRYILMQGLSQGLAMGAPNRLNCNILGGPIFHGSSQYTQITTINMYLLMEIGHNIH